MLLLCACSKDTNTQEEPPTPPTDEKIDMDFTFEVVPLKPNTADITIIPSIEGQTWYWCRATEKEFAAAGNEKSKVLGTFLKKDIEYGIQEEGFNHAEAVADISHEGTFTNTIQSLFGSTTYHLLAVAIDPQGNPISEVTDYTFESMKTPVSLNTFTIQIPEEKISFASAEITILTTNQDPYTWFMTTSEQGTPEELAETYIEEMGLLLNTGYSDIYTGKQTFTYTNLLEPDTDYTIVVFGYEAGRTTSIESSRFKTLPAGDPTQTTFQFTVNPDRLTARGAEITVTPSDPSVLYWYEILPSEIFTQYGSEKETISAYLKEIFTVYGQQGYSIETIVRSFCTRGEAKLSYGPEALNGILTPETEYTPFAVCMNLDGTMAGNVFTGEPFTTPQATLSSALATVEMVTFYDCDEVAASTPGLESYVGQNLLVLDLKIQPNTDTANWYFLCATSDYTDTKQYPEEEVLTTILTNVATGATIKNELYPLLLFPADQKGTFLTVAQDAAGNFGRIERIAVGPLSKSDASPYPASIAAMRVLTSVEKFCATPAQPAWPDYLTGRTLEHPADEISSLDGVSKPLFQR